MGIKRRRKNNKQQIQIQTVNQKSVLWRGLAIVEDSQYLRSKSVRLEHCSDKRHHINCSNTIEMVLALAFLALSSWLHPHRGYKNPRQFDECYEVIETISENSDTEVHIHKVRRRRDGQIFCAKVFYKGVQIKRGDANEWNEIKYLKELRHVNVVQLEEYFDEEERIVIVCEYLEVNLYDILKCYKRLPESDVKTIARTLFGLLCHLAQRDIVHGDLVLQNLMLKSDDDPYTNLKMVDFNTCDTEKSRATLRKITQFSDFPSSQPSSLAPETIQHFILNKKSDVWSAGILLYTLLFGTVPFDGKNAENIYSNILTRQIRFFIEDEAGQLLSISNECQDFLKQILHKQHELRLSPEEALLHPWLNDHS